MLFNRQTNSSDNRSIETFPGSRERFLSAFGRPEIQAKIKGLEAGQTLHYFVKGYNLYDIFAELMKISGPADVYIATYSITEFPLRILSQFKSQGMIKGLQCLFDLTVKRTPQLKQFAEQICDRYRYLNIHSKIAVIQNESWSITLKSSANWTSNHRHEDGTVFTDPDVANNYITLLKDQLDATV